MNSKNDFAGVCKCGATIHGNGPSGRAAIEPTDAYYKRCGCGEAVRMTLATKTLSLRAAFNAWVKANNVVGAALHTEGTRGGGSVVRGIMADVRIGNTFLFTCATEAAARSFFAKPYAG